MNTGGCSEGSAHVVATVRSVPGLINFILNLEMPVPINRLFNHHEKWILQFISYCSCPLMLLNPQRKFVGGHERWAIHCHCKDPYSLQCLCAAVVMQKAISLYVYGAGFNSKFLFYREICNYNCSNMFGYVGSVYFRKFHYIYLKIKDDEMYVHLRKKMLFGNHVCTSTIFGNYIILICKNCKSLSPAAVQACARKVRKKIVHCYKTLDEKKQWKFVNAQKYEKFRTSCIRKFCRYQVPINIKHPNWFSF